MARISTLTNLLYPPACLLCGTALQQTEDPRSSARCAIGEVIICGTCRMTFQRCGPPVCMRCGVVLPGAFDANHTCATCQRMSPAYEAARAPWQYAGAIQQAVQQFKYHRRWRLGQWLAQDMSRVAQAAFSQPLDTIVPVPLYWLKHRLKGFNPAEDMARAIAQSLGVTYTASALRRTRWTPSQTTLPWSQRHANVEGAFVADRRGLHRGTILLVDDVLTSGATAQACAEALKEAGARCVFVLAAARTPMPHAG